MTSLILSPCLVTACSRMMANRFVFPVPGSRFHENNCWWPRCDILPVLSGRHRALDQIRPPLRLESSLSNTSFYAVYDLSIYYTAETNVLTIESHTWFIGNVVNDNYKPNCWQLIMISPWYLVRIYCSNKCLIAIFYCACDVRKLIDYTTGEFYITINNFVPLLLWRHAYKRSRMQIPGHFLYMQDRRS